MDPSSNITSAGTDRLGGHGFQGPRKDTLVEVEDLSDDELRGRELEVSLREDIGLQAGVPALVTAFFLWAS
jgi:hypothetical protein